MMVGVWYWMCDSECLMVCVCDGGYVMVGM